MIISLIIEAENEIMLFWRVFMYICIFSNTIFYEFIKFEFKTIEKLFFLKMDFSDIISVAPNCVYSPDSNFIVVGAF